jgi:hypothetical protein
MSMGMRIITLATPNELCVLYITITILQKHISHDFQDPAVVSRCLVEIVGIPIAPMQVLSQNLSFRHPFHRKVQ